MANVLLYHLYAANIPSAETALDIACEAFDAPTRQRLQKIKDRQLRNRSICSKLMLYQMANEQLGHITPQKHPIRYDQRGQPTLTGLALGFSISYQEDWISVAITNQGNVGIDVETLARNERFAALPATWQQKLATCSISKWNELEAYAKYWGTGLGIVFATPFPVAADIAIVHRPVSNEIDCCVIGAGDVQVSQHYVMLDDVVYAFNNALA